MEKGIKSDIKEAIKKYTIWFIVYFAVCILSFCILNRKSFFTFSDGLYQQYIYFLYTGKWYRRLFSNIFVDHLWEIPMWDMNIGMGADPIVTFSVYNPFDLAALISAITPLNIGEYVFDIIILTRHYLAGAFFLLFAYYKLRNINSAVIGSLVYAFSAVVFVGYGQAGFQVIFMQFPLLMLGVDRLWEKRGHRFYTLVLIWCAANSFYFTYMMGILIIAYCVLRFFVERRKFSELVSLLVRFVIWTAIGLSAGAVFFFSYIYNLSGIDRLSQGFNIGIFNFDMLLNVVSGLFSDVALFHDSYWGFSSIFFISVILLFRDKSKNLLLKILVVIFPLTLLFPVVGSFFNGMSSPTDRYVFGYALIVAYTVALMYDKFSEFKGRIWYVSLIVSLIYACASALFCGIVGALSGISLVICLGALGLINTKYATSVRNKNRIYGGLILFTILFISYPAFPMNFNAGGQDFGKANHDLFETSGAELLDQADDISNVRCDYVPYSFDAVPSNTSMILGINGYDFYHSNYNNNIDRYYDQLAILSDPIGFSYTGLRGRNYLEMMNGSKYLICYEGKESALNAPYSYSHICSDGEFGLYACSGEPSLVYFYDDLASNDEYMLLTPIEREELMMHACVIDGDAPVYGAVGGYGEAEYEITELNNIEFVDDHTFTASDDAYMLLSIDDISDAEIDLYVKGLNSDQGFVIVPMLMNGDDILTADFMSGIGTGNAYYHWKDTVLFNFGYSEDTADHIKILFRTPGNYTLEDIKVYVRDSAQIEETVKAFSEHADIGDIDYSLDGNHIDISAYADHDKYLYIAVPYSDGWHAEVDGAETDIVKANTAFMMIPLKEGDHKIELRYETPHLKEGAVVSFISLAVWGVYETVSLRKNRKCRIKK